MIYIGVIILRHANISYLQSKYIMRGICCVYHIAKRQYIIRAKPVTPLRGGFFFDTGFFQSSTERILIFSFFSKKIYAPSETMLSKTFPSPNRIAMPIREGVHTPVRYRMNAPP